MYISDGLIKHMQKTPGEARFGRKIGFEINKSNVKYQNTLVRLDQ